MERERAARLQRAVRQVFAEWTLVQLALEHAWAGSRTRGFVEQSVDRIVAMCQRHTKKAMTRDQFDDALLDLVDDLNAVADDGSVGSICVLFAAIHAEALLTDSNAPSPVTDALLLRAAASSSSSVVKQSTRRAGEYDGGSDEDNDDDDDNDHDDVDADAGGDDNDEPPAAVAVAAAPAPPVAAPVAAPASAPTTNDDDDDGDGWTTVPKGKAKAVKGKR